MTINMWIASVAWLLLALGYTQRRNRKRHVPLVLAAIGMDIGLVLYLQFTRSAVQKALEFSLKILQQIHIGFSTLALLLYFPILFLGFKLLRGDRDPKTRLLHIRIATIALIARTLGFCFMFSMWKD